jgi:type I restriction enzyme, S subunit
MNASPQLVSLENAPLQIIDGDRGAHYPKQNEFSEVGFCLFLNAGNVTKTGFNLNSCQFINESKDRLLRKGRLCRDDIVMTTRGTLGNIAYYSEGVDFENIRINSGMVLIRARKADLRPKYLYCALRSSVVLDQINQLKSGVAQPQLPIRDLKKIKIPIPPPDVQDRIANAIGAYDISIANNTRRIELLERSARLLFEEWFVRLRYPGHEHDKIVDGVPDEWGSSTVDGVCSVFLDGDWLESKDQGGYSFRILQISNIGENAFVETGNYRFITEETFKQLNCTEVRPGDIIISRMPEPIGRAWLVTEKPWKMVTAVDVTIARPDSDKVDLYYFLHHLNSHPHIARCKARATGATRPRVAKRVMAALPILLPPHTLQKEFSSFASVVNEMKERLVRQNERLAKARDLLLPRLMDGRIEV